MPDDGGVKIGLFHGMFDKNTIAFNPPGVRAVQASAEAAGFEAGTKAEPGEGPAFATLIDPDGNPLLFDQH